ncbi:MAG: DUF1778 domain-containing protein [Verrucomicrobiota bacterium]
MQSGIRLSQEDARKNLSLLDNPPKPNKGLKEAVKAVLQHGGRDRGSRRCRAGSCPLFHQGKQGG